MAKGSINKAILIGTLGRDPELRYLPNGNAVCSIALATDEGYKDRNTGQQINKTEWHRVEAFGRLAEIIAEYCKKGAKIYIEGKLRTDEYEKDGIKRYATKIIANEMTMLGGKNNSAALADSSGGYPAQSHYPPASAQQQHQAQQGNYAPHSNSFDTLPNDEIDDIPF